MIDLNALGERSILIDCDVLQADGGTRTASITGSCVALGLAVQKLITDGKLAKNPLQGTVSAISVGIKGGRVLVDLDYAEDSTCDVDMNFVITGQGRFVEVQGTAEKQAFSFAELTAMTHGAQAACEKIRALQLQACPALSK